MDLVQSSNFFNMHYREYGAISISRNKEKILFHGINDRNFILKLRFYFLISMNLIWSWIYFKQDLKKIPTSNIKKKKNTNWYLNKFQNITDVARLEECWLSHPHLQVSHLSLIHNYLNYVNRIQIWTYEKKIYKLH